MEEKEKRIKNWILKNGYPFEMKIASLFQKKGFKTSQSVLYKDIDTNKYREIDIIAYKNKIVNNVSFSFSFVIECKKSTDKPWVVFKNDKLINNKLNRFKLFATNNAQILLDKTKETTKFNKRILKNILPDVHEAGYNLVMSFKENKDLAYSSTTSLIKACKYIIEKFNNSSLRQCNVYFPIIVIEGDLYDSYLDSDGEILLKSKGISSVLNTKVFDEEEFSNVIRIISSSYIEKFIKDISYDLESFFNVYEKEIEGVSLSNPGNNNASSFHF